MPVVAVGAVGVIVLALLAILIVFAAELLTKLIVNLVNRIPYVGGWLGGQLEHFAVTVIADTKAACYAVMSPIGNFFAAIGQHLVGMWDAAAHFASEVSVTLERLYHVTLPGVIETAVSKAIAWVRPFTMRLFDRAEALTRLAVHELDVTIHGIESRAVALERTVARDIAGVDHKIATVAGELVHDIAAAEVTAIDTARSLANSVRVDLTHALEVADAGIESTIAATAHGLENLVQTAVTDLTDLTVQGDQAVEAAIDTAASTVAVAAWPVITDIVDGIKGAVVPVEDVIKGAVDAIPQAVPTTLEGTLAATMAIATVGADFANECGLDLCANLGGLGGFLSNLGADLAEGALFGLVALLIVDPQAGADMTRATLGPIVSGASAMVTEVIDIGKAVA